MVVAPGDGVRMTAACAAGQPDEAALLWRQMALSVAPGRRSARMPIHAGLRPVLRLFEIAASGSLTGGPSVPSAGALYPYEHVAVVAGEDGPEMYGVDVARRSCRLLGSGARVEGALDEAGLGPCRPGAAVLLTVVRPWLSMRKYGTRGYLYAHLDAAHLATHLLCLAAGTHAGAQLRTRLAAGALGDLLALDATCRFLHSALVLQGPPSEAATFCDAAWTCADLRDGPPPAPVVSGLERECWGPIARHRETARAADPALDPALDPAAGPARVRARPLLPGAASWLGAGSPEQAEPWAVLAARRRSTKDFAAATLPGRTLDRTLAALATPLPTDLPDDTGLRVTLVVRDVAGWAPGSHPLDGPGRPTRPVAACPDTDEMVRMCMGQEHLRHGCVVVLFHAPRSEIVGRGARGVDTALLRAGALAHLLYLGAAASGAAVTTIGGFDSDRWRTLARLPDGHDVLYVAMLGVPGTAAVKLDRLSTPIHDERWSRAD